MQDGVRWANYNKHGTQGCGSTKTAQGEKNILMTPRYNRKSWEALLQIKFGGIIIKRNIAISVNELADGRAKSIINDASKL